MLKDREAYEARLDEQLARWGADLEKLRDKAKVAGVDGMMKYDETVEALKQKHADASVHLGRLKAAGDDTWEQVKTGLEKGWEEFKALFGRATDTTQP
jgi:hypothetical protein